MLLTKETGMTLRDIRGWTETNVRTERRTDVVAAVRRALPWVSNPSPKEIVEQRSVPGLSEQEVLRRLIIHDEHEEMKEEEAEKEENRARRKAGNFK